MTIIHTSLLILSLIEFNQNFTDTNTKFLNIGIPLMDFSSWSVFKVLDQTESSLHNQLILALICIIPYNVILVIPFIVFLIFFKKSLENISITCSWHFQIVDEEKVQGTQQGRLEDR